MDNRSNTLARYKLLQKALRGHKQTPSALLSACRSQGGLARLDLPSEGISPIALNTLKRKADETIEDGGWSKLEAMRKSYLAVGKGLSANASNKVSSQEKNKSLVVELRSALATERRYRLRLQTAYEALLRKLRRETKNNPDLDQFINGHVVGFSFKRLSIVEKQQKEE